MKRSSKYSSDKVLKNKIGYFPSYIRKIEKNTVCGNNFFDYPNSSSPYSFQ